jgi:hypothetical protein
MTPCPWPSTLVEMDLVVAMSPTEMCVAILLFTGVAAPLAGLVLRRVAGGWDSIGKGPLAIEPRSPTAAELETPAGDDPELQSEVRQLVVSRNERRQRQGLEPLNVEAETERRLADLVGSS